MSEKTAPNHPDIETLARYLAGRLSQSDTEDMRVHLETCPVCRLEVKRIERFETIDSDADLRERANWQTARIDLERAFEKNVLPEVVTSESRRSPLRGTERAGASFWDRWKIRWLAPVVGAVAVALVLIQVSERIGPEGEGDADVMRGPSTETFDIAIEEPLGNLTEPPAVFAWKSRRDNDAYTIEIFTSDLTKIYQEDDIEGTRWVAGDSLISLLEIDTLYLWSVTGHKRLERETVSPNGWFKIIKEGEKPESR